MNRVYVLCMAVMAVVLVLAGCDAPVLSEPTQPPPTNTTAPAATLEPTEPPATPTRQGTVFEGDVPVGFTEDGLPYRGDPDAPVTMMEYSEFQ